ncbi:hypothetical protein CEXT_628101 [Caerostris extrusa]|uniref:Uncharacterized protein n=1 Tax=Caerostris extrusa TaxID=172846 RepID=A0AAV4UQ10_CAEEX|nr:hypothetical protein CEXT_628101 [Caerostris extrusa]
MGKEGTMIIRIKKKKKKNLLADPPISDFPLHVVPKLAAQFPSSVKQPSSSTPDKRTTVAGRRRRAGLRPDTRGRGTISLRLTV